MNKWLLLLIILGGAFLRLAALNDPITYDEAYTYVAFARQDWWGALSDYSLPNNHIFHTLLVKLSVGLFGNHPPVIRLPAFLAGVAAIPLVYVLGKNFYGKTTGLSAAALVAWLPAMVRYDTDARGYSLVSLCALLCWWAAAQSLQENRLRHWLLLSTALTVGMFTIPTMLLPAGGIFLWLLAEAIGRRETSKTFYLGLFGSGLLAVAITALLYTPVLLVSGWQKLLANNFVLPVEPQLYFSKVLWQRLAGTWEMWTMDIPLAFGMILSLGVILSLVMHRWIAFTLLHLAAPMGVWLSIYIVARRPDAYDRFWAFLLAPILLWAAAGLVETVDSLGRRAIWSRLRRRFLKTADKPRLSPFRWGVLGLWISLGLLASSAWNAASLFSYRWNKRGNPEAIATYLHDKIGPRNIVLAGYPNDAPLWYYMDRLGIPETAWQARSDFDHAILIIAENFGQTPARVMRSYKLDPALCDLKNAARWERFGQIYIYGCEHR